MIRIILAAIGFFALMDHLSLVSVQLISMFQTDPMLLADPVTTSDLKLMWWYVGSLALVDFMLVFAFFDFFFLRFRFPRPDYFIGISHFALASLWLVLGLIGYMPGESQGSSFFAAFIGNQQPSLLIGGVGSIVILILLLMRKPRSKRSLG